MSEGSGRRYCGNCGTEIKPGTSFCISCGQQMEGNEGHAGVNARFGTTGMGSGGGSSLDQRNVRLGLLGVGALLTLIMAYLILSYSVTLGFLLITLSALAVLVVRKNRGLQTRREQQLFDTANQYKESVRRAYEEGKHREIAQNAYQQSRRGYNEASTRYQRSNQQKAAERERTERQRITDVNRRMNPDTERTYEDGRRFQPGDKVKCKLWVRAWGGEPRWFKAVILESTHNKVHIEFVGDSLTYAYNEGWSRSRWVAPNQLKFRYFS